MNRDPVLLCLLVLLLASVAAAVPRFAGSVARPLPEGRSVSSARNDALSLFPRAAKKTQPVIEQDEEEDDDDGEDDEEDEEPPPKPKGKGKILEAIACISAGGFAISCEGDGDVIKISSVSVGANAKGKCGKATKKKPQACKVNKKELVLMRERVEAAFDGEQSGGAAIRELMPSTRTCKSTSAYMSIKYACMADEKQISDGAASAGKIQLNTLCPEDDSYEIDIDCGTRMILVERATLGWTPHWAETAQCDEIDEDAEDKPKLLEDPSCGMEKTDKNALPAVGAACQGKRTCAKSMTAQKLLGQTSLSTGLKCAGGKPILRLWYRCSLTKPPPAATKDAVDSARKAEKGPPKLLGVVTAAVVLPDGSGLIQGWACLTASSAIVPLWIMPGDFKSTGKRVVAMGFAKDATREGLMRPPKPDEDPIFVKDSCLSKAVTPFFTVAVPADFFGGQESVEVAVLALDPESSQQEAFGASRYTQLQLGSSSLVRLAPSKLEIPVGAATVTRTDDDTITVNGYACVPGSPETKVEVRLLLSSKSNEGPFSVQQIIRADKPQPGGVAGAECKGNSAFTTTVDLDDNLDGQYLSIVATDPDKKRKQDKALLDKPEQLMIPLDGMFQPDNAVPNQFVARTWESLFITRGLLAGFAPSEDMLPGRTFRNPIMVPKFGRASYRPTNKFFLDRAQAIQTQTRTESKQESQMAEQGFQSVSVDVSASYMRVSASAHFGMSSSSDRLEKKMGYRNSAVTTITIPKVEVSIDKELFDLNPAFLADVRAFIAGRQLSQPCRDPDLDAWLAVIMKWGIIFPRRVVLGAKMYLTSETEINESFDSRGDKIRVEVGASLSFDGLTSSGSVSTSASTETATQQENKALQKAQSNHFSIMGGDETLYNNEKDVAAWRASVNKGWRYWQVIEVKDVVPIDELLPPELVPDVTSVIKQCMVELRSRSTDMARQINNKWALVIANQKADEARATEIANQAAAELTKERYWNVTERQAQSSQVTVECPPKTGKIKFTYAWFFESSIPDNPKLLRRDFWHDVGAQLVRGSENMGCGADVLQKLSAHCNAQAIRTRCIVGPDLKSQLGDTCSGWWKKLVTRYTCNG
ncbi:hypothetical protein DFJ74DRAFT_704077 [Hyaloraphidium curvatum]|nr:hypothetical protein DFJ74DRAFT_704077 [Hyaloraphidium curvatum]